VYAQKAIGKVKKMIDSSPLPELWRKVLDNMDVGIVFIDADNKIVLFNREAGKMLNEDPEERIGTSILLCHPKESEEILREKIDEYRRGRVRVKHRITNYQGNYLQETFCPIFDDEGNYLGLMDVLHDASEKVSLLKELGKIESIPSGISGLGSRRPQEATAGQPSI
jgi:PAS domain S-box-containing protein